MSRSLLTFRVAAAPVASRPLRAVAGTVGSGGRAPRIVDDEHDGLVLRGQVDALDVRIVRGPVTEMATPFGGAGLGSPRILQTRTTVDWLVPRAFAKLRLVQWRAGRGGAEGGLRDLVCKSWGEPRLATGTGDVVLDAGQVMDQESSAP